MQIAASAAKVPQARPLVDHGEKELWEAGLQVPRKVSEAITLGQRTLGGTIDVRASG